MRAALVAVYLAASLLAALYSVLSWRRRRSAPLARSLALITAGATLWSLAQSVALAVASPTVAMVATYAVFPGVAMVVGGFFWHTTVFTGRGVEQLRRRSRLLLIHPVVLLAVVATDPWHHAFFRSFTERPGGGVVEHPGLLYWVHTAYCYALIAVGAARAVTAMRRAVRGHRRVFVIFLAGALIPSAGNLVSVFLPLGGRDVDLTPVLFLVSATMWWWAERSGMTARQTPVAYRQVIDALSDAVMVLDGEGRFLDVNPAAVRMLASPGSVIGRLWYEVTDADLAGAFPDAGQCTITVGGGAVYDVRVVPIPAPDGGDPGTVVVVRDVTELERLRAELTDQAIRDALTGVFNRRHLTAALREQVRQAVAGGRPLSAVMIDVDHFKAVNDTYGHAVGDAVLIRLAQEIGTAVGDLGIVARYGGEEFAIVLPGMDAPSATRLAEQWRRRCSHVVVDTPRGPLRATFSAGVAELAAGADAEDLLRRADRALYGAKARGRDRVVTDSAAAPGGLRPVPR